MKDYTEAEKDAINLSDNILEFIEKNRIINQLPVIERCQHALDYFKLRERYAIALGRFRLGGFNEVLDEEDLEALRSSLFEISNMFDPEQVAMIGSYLVDNCIDLVENNLPPGE